MRGLTSYQRTRLVLDSSQPGQKVSRFASLANQPRPAERGHAQAQSNAVTPIVAFCIAEKRGWGLVRFKVTPIIVGVAY